MSKKHVHHFNRGIVIGLEAFGFIVLLLFLAWFALIVRLSQGPLDVSFLTKNIEQELNNYETGFLFDVGSTSLIWGGRKKPFEFEMKNVQVSRSDKTPVFAVDKVGLELSKRALVFGNIVPRVIRIYGPALKIIRGEGGGFLLNMIEADTYLASDASEGNLGGDQEGVDFLQKALFYMKNPESFNLLKGLKQISVTDAALLYEDKVLNVVWKSKRSDLTFTRERTGLLVDVAANLKMNADKEAYLQSSFHYNWETQRPSGVLHFTGFNPSLLLKDSAPLKHLADVDLSLKGSLALEVNKNFQPEAGRFIVAADSGVFNAFNLYEAPLPVKSFYTKGSFDLTSKEAVVEEFKLGIEDAVLNLEANLKKSEEDRALKIKASLENMPVNSLDLYWPKTLAESPRAWVTQNISVGTALKSTLNLELLSPKADLNIFKVKKLDGDISFKDLKVKYFSKLKPVTKVTGKASYDRKSFHIDVNSARLGNINLKKSSVDITGIDTQSKKNPSKIDIALKMEGPFKTALEVLDTEPLDYPKQFGIHTADADGNAEIDVNFKFPLHKELEISEIKVKTHAEMSGVYLDKVIFGMPLVGATGSMDFDVDTHKVSVKGMGLLGGMPVDFDWVRDFSKTSPFLTKVEAKLSLGEAMFEKLGVPNDFSLAGNVPAHITYTKLKDQTGTIIFKGDLTPASFTLPVIGYIKEKDLSSKLEMVAHLNKKGTLSRLSSFHLATKNALFKGDVDFTSDGKSLKKASFDHFKVNGTDVALTAKNKGKDGYILKLSGKRFDASKFLSAYQARDKSLNKSAPPVGVAMSVDRLITGEGNKYIEKVEAVMHRNSWGRVEQLELDGISGGKPLHLRYLPVASGHSLTLTADNAGVALSALGITDNVRGGKLSITGAPHTTKEGPRDLAGSIVVTDFSLVNVPALGMLLNAMSLTGFVELLNGKGIAFKKMRSEFFWADRMDAKGVQKVALIRLKEGKTSGSSLGITFDGTIDQLKNSMNIDGTIIPASNLSKMVGSIPLVGTILTGGGGGGVFAATYAIKGPTANPKVTVNPLSVLAPGILRKIFFER